MSGSTRSYELARRLVAEGHEVHMLTTDRTLNKSNKNWYKTIEEGINIYWYSVPYSNCMSYTRRIKAFIKFIFAASFKALSIKVHIIFCTSTPLTVVIPGIIASLFQRIPMIFEVRDLWPEIPIEIGAIKNIFLKKVVISLAKFAYNRSDFIIALSPGMKEGIMKYGISHHKIKIIPNSCDIELFNVSASKGKEFRKRNKWLDNNPLIVYTGTLGRINGVTYLVKLAYEIFNMNSSFRFLIVGNGYEYKKVKETAKKLNIYKKNFFMLPEISKIEMPTILSAADIATSLFINLPGMEANSANKFFDALAAGKPIAINYKGWQANLLNESGAGIILSYNNIQEAAQELMLFINDSERMRKARQAARRLAYTKFNRDLLAKDFESILINTAKNKIKNV